MKIAPNLSLSVRSLVAAAGLILSVNSAWAAPVLPDQYYTEAAGLDLGTMPAGYFRNDDAFFGQYSLGFELQYFGETYSSFFLNNNGNISFGHGFPTYTPSPLNTTTVAPSVAPYWADVDTRTTTGGNVYFNTSVANQLIVTWDKVGYFNQHTDKTASFQLVLRGPNYSVPGDEGKIGFFYKNVGWETGDASGGSGGFGGTEATVGFGDGKSAIAPGEVSLTGSQQAGIRNVVQGQHFWFNLDNGVVLGGSQSTPILPGGAQLPGWTSTQPFWSFQNVFNGAWVDPVPTTDFYFQQAGDSLFTGFRMPSLNYGNLAVESLDGTLLDARLDPNEFFTFSNPLSGFRIFGFDPSIDGSNTTAFPIQLFFDDPTADFLMGPAPITRLVIPNGAVPEPSTYGMVGAGALLLGVMLRRRFSRR